MALRTTVLLSFVLALLMAGLHLAIYPPDTSDSAWDSYDYKTFARNPLASSTPPFGYRPLSPLIVYLLPCSIRAGFILLTAISLCLGAVVVCEICRRSGLGRWEAMAAVPLYMLHGGTRWLLRAPCHVDAVSTLISALVVLSLVSGYVGLAGPLLTIGVTNKENAFFLIPFYWLARWSRREWRPWMAESFLVSLSMLAVFAVIRYVWYPMTLDALSFTGVRHRYEFFAFYRSELARLWDLMGQRRLSDPATYTFGAATLGGLAALGLRGASRQLRAGLLLLPFVILQLFFVTGDLRLKHQALPIILPLALRGAVRFCGEMRWARTIALMVTSVAYILSPDSVALGVVLTFSAVSAGKLISQFPMKNSWMV